MRRLFAISSVPVILFAVSLQAQTTSGVIDCRSPQGEVSEALANHLAGICHLLSGQLDPSLADDLHLAIVTEHLSPDLFRGHLEWTHAGDVFRGPTVDVGFLDAPLSESFYQFVVSSLLNSTDLPIEFAGE